MCIVMAEVEKDKKRPVMFHASIYVLIWQFHVVKTSSSFKMLKFAKHGMAFAL